MFEIRTKAPRARAQADVGDRHHGELLDAVDHAIVRLLQRDGRVSNTEMGRELGLTETTIRKRVARLIADELISIVAVPTPQAEGLTTSAIIGISVHLQHLHAVSDQLVSLPEVRTSGFRPAGMTSSSRRSSPIKSTCWTSFPRSSVGCRGSQRSRLR